LTLKTVSGIIWTQKFYGGKKVSEIIRSEFGKEISPEVIAARQNLMSGEIPPHARKVHQGKGGKMFHYFSHAWGTSQLRDGLQAYWNMACRSWEIFDDRSCAALVSLWVNWPTKDGYLVQEITEIGAYEDSTNKMPKAMIVASAVSRGLCKCMMRMFGIGAEFYEEDAEMTPEMAWTSLKKFAIARGVEEQVLIDKIKEAGITKDNLLDRFGDAYSIVSELAGTKPVVEEVPEDLE